MRINKTGSISLTFASEGAAAGGAPPSGDDLPSPGGAVATGSKPNSNALMASKHLLEEEDFRKFNDRHNYR